MQKIIVVLSILVLFFLGYYYASSTSSTKTKNEDETDNKNVEIVDIIKIDNSKEYKPVSDACRDFIIDPNKDCYKQLYPLTLPYVNYTKEHVSTFPPQPCV